MPTPIPTPTPTPIYLMECYFSLTPCRPVAPLGSGAEFHSEMRFQRCPLGASAESWLYGSIGIRQQMDFGPAFHLRRVRRFPLDSAARRGIHSCPQHLYHGKGVAQSNKELTPIDCRNSHTDLPLMDRGHSNVINLPLPSPAAKRVQVIPTELLIWTAAASCRF
jgi:hypothetical protein